MKQMLCVCFQLSLFYVETGNLNNTNACILHIFYCLVAESNRDRKMYSKKIPTQLFASITFVSPEICSTRQYNVFVPKMYACVCFKGHYTFDNTKYTHRRYVCVSLRHWFIDFVQAFIYYLNRIPLIFFCEQKLDDW